MSAAPGKPLRVQLGLAAEGLEVLASVPMPKGSVAHGLAGALPPARALSEAFADVPVDAAAAARWPFLLTRHTLEPGVVRVEDGPPPRDLAGSAELIDGAVWLDGRGDREGACVIEAPGESFLIEVGRDAITVSRCGGAPDWAPLPDKFEAAPPSLADLLAGRPCADWLRQRAQHLAASPALIERAAAVGLVVRLWQPAAADRAAILAGQATDPSEPAAAWVAALGDSRTALAHLVIHRAASLREAFDTLPSRDADPSDEEVLALLYERDALESVRVLLSFAGEGLPPARALALTDDVAATTWSAIAPSERLRNDPLLRAVFLSEPESFWGQLAEA